jgi:hypothetical protein
MPEMDAVKDAALKYDKPTLARLAQSGQLSPTLAVMAGMMRDRVVQSEMKPPTPPNGCRRSNAADGPKDGSRRNRSRWSTSSSSTNAASNAATTTAPRPRFRSSTRPPSDV